MFEPLLEVEEKAKWQASKDQIIRALVHTHGHARDAAFLLQVNPQSLYNRIRKLKIDLADYKIRRSA